MIELVNKKIGEIFRLPTPDGKPCEIEGLPLADKEIMEYFKKRMEMKSKIQKRRNKR